MMRLTVTTLLAILNLYSVAGSVIPRTPRTRSLAAARQDDGPTRIPLRRSARNSDWKRDDSSNPDANTGLDHVDLVRFEDNNWYGNISVGTPAVVYQVMFDTGSSDLFLPGVDCVGSANRTVFDGSKSNTAIDLNSTFTIPSFDGGKAIVGNSFQDLVSAGNFSVTNQTFGVASDYGTFSMSGDGVMGLGFPEISYTGNGTSNSFLQRGKGPSPSDFDFFSMKFSDDKDGPPGIFFNGLTESYSQNDFYFANVQRVNGGLWRITMPEINVIFDNNTHVNDATLESISVIIDSGTQMIIGDPALVKKFYDNIPNATHNIGDQFYTYPCPGEQAPSVQLVLPDLAGNRKEFDVPPNDFNVKNSTDSSFCRGAVIPDVSLSDTNTMIIGNIFLKNAYTQFDYTPGKERVGFAYLK